MSKKVKYGIFYLRIASRFIQVGELQFTTKLLSGVVPLVSVLALGFWRVHLIKIQILLK